MHQRDNTSRREFLRGSIAAAASVGALNPLVRAESAEATNRPAWPVTCRDALLREAGGADIWAIMDAVGVDGAEVLVNPDMTMPNMVAPGKTYSIATPDDIKRLADELADKKRQIGALCLFSRFDDRPEQEVDLTVKTARAAAALGSPVVRIDLVPHKIKDPDEYVKFCIKIGRQIVDATKDLPVRFGVENHGGTTNRPEFLRSVFDGIGSKRFGLTLDAGNFYWFGHPLSKLYDIYAEFAPWTCHVHCKSIRYPEADRQRQREMGWKYAECRCPIYEGDIDYERLARILRKSGYQGDLCIDDESLRKFPEDQRGEILKKDVAFLRRIARIG
ncbi:MAG: sugar phosphate isomerase/epimerase [Phycisphaerae bacterium]|nr:sugar phosphate isomerase/epimerase [Phycisphaerae bacterium]